MYKYFSPAPCRRKCKTANEGRIAAWTCFMSHFTRLSWWTCLFIGWCSIASEEGNRKLSVFWVDFWGNCPFGVFVNTHSTLKPKYCVNTTISPNSDRLKDQVFQMWSYKLDSWQKDVFKINDRLMQSNSKKTNRVQLWVFFLITMRSFRYEFNKAL